MNSKDLQMFWCYWDDEELDRLAKLKENETKRTIPSSKKKRKK